MDKLGNFREEVLLRGVEDRVSGVEAETVDMKVAVPIDGVIEEKIPHRSQLEIQGIAPWGFVFVIEVVAAVAAEVIAVRPEMVVDDSRESPRAREHGPHRPAPGIR